MKINGNNALNLSVQIFSLIASFLQIAAAIVIKNRGLIVFTCFVFAVFIFAFARVNSRYEERVEFIEFIEYLFDNSTHKFTLLPKICLALDKERENSSLTVREMNVKYTYDMSEVTLVPSDVNKKIEYLDKIEYSLNAERKNLPKEFCCYLGNMYSIDTNAKISQKHGTQTEYEVVPTPRYRDETYTDSIVQRYSWELRNENIKNESTIPISFLLEYKEKARAQSNDTIIIYPRQYAKEIEKIKFEIKFLGNAIALKKVELYKIHKDGKKFKQTPISVAPIKESTVEFEIKPESKKYEAYYFRVFWEPV